MRDLEQVRPPRYVAVQAFLPATPEVGSLLEELARRLTALTGAAVTVGYGPRFLHSTGQLHKGGTPGGWFLQLVDRPATDLPVPETDHTYGRIVAAQADGDFQALIEAGRDVRRVDLGRGSAGRAGRAGGGLVVMTHRPAAETVQIEPNLVILFGATGDLARRSLLPALYRLLRRREFADKLHVLGVATKSLDDDGFRRLARDAVVAAGLDRTEVEEWCGRNLSYQPVGEGYEALARRVQEVERQHDLPGNRAFYLAVPPQVFEETVEGIAGAGLHRSGGWVRIVVEKPFGTDLESARRLNRLLHRHFDESQIYRIDHFLAKETVQNLLVFRFANPLFESAWNRDRVQAVQITVAEDIGIGDRAGYFDKAGTLRDMVQNHLAQLLTLVAMEPPVRFEPDDIRNEKVKVLRAIRPLEPGDVVRGRYGPGMVDGEAVVGYLEEPGVPSDSTTETYAAVRFEIDNWRWRGVPFLARTGKRMARRLTQIVVVFREPPVGLFSAHGGQVRGNELYITLQPDEGFDLLFDVKTPGEGGGDPHPVAQLPLRRRLRSAPRRLRDAAGRHPGRRPDTVRPGRRGGGGLADPRPRPRPEDRPRLLSRRHLGSRLGRPARSGGGGSLAGPRPRLDVFLGGPAVCRQMAGGGVEGNLLQFGGQRVVPAVEKCEQRYHRHDLHRLGEGVVPE
ncbi:MAG: hypothetical protein KatS3mg011_1256 [Acidimicrobiia bacterium]|nr:MAG: hypothetical protein KatS3mg011_1256 [Acidimicrobiia bacterium]